MSTYELCVRIWEDNGPPSLRQAKRLIVEAMAGEGLAVTDGTLNVYYSRWRKAKGVTRRYRKAASAVGGEKIE